MTRPNLPHPLPAETPQYRAARNDLLEKEIALRALTAEVAEARRALPPGGAMPQDYTFTGQTGRIRLSDMFGSHDSLMIYSLMYGPDAQAPCPMCTAFLDCLNGAAPLVRQRCDLAIVMSGPLAKGLALQQARGWNNLDLLSAAGTSYNRDYFGETADGAQLPMLNVFTRQDGTVRHFWASEMFFAGLDGHPRHIDTIWPLWNALDFLPEGRGTDWYPAL
jgi:predicted dithiol-disulfide oxidoreductase (DUF899 family)